MHTMQDWRKHIYTLELYFGYITSMSPPLSYKLATAQMNAPTQTINEWRPNNLPISSLTREQGMTQFSARRFNAGGHGVMIQSHVC